jgi:hypothetical protein
MDYNQFLMRSLALEGCTKKVEQCSNEVNVCKSENDSSDSTCKKKSNLVFRIVRRSWTTHYERLRKLQRKGNS